MVLYFCLFWLQLLCFALSGSRLSNRRCQQESPCFLIDDIPCTFPVREPLFHQNVFKTSETSGKACCIRAFVFNVVCTQVCICVCVLVCQTEREREAPSCMQTPPTHKKNNHEFTLYVLPSFTFYPCFLLSLTGSGLVY